MTQPYNSKDDLAKLFYAKFLNNDPNFPTHVIVQDELFDSRYEWQVLGGVSKPLYQGLAVPGSSVDAAVWRIQKFNYVLSGAGDYVVTYVPTAIGAWSARATLLP